MKKVSIIIRTKNEEKLIGKTLNGIFNQCCDPHEVILIDSGSTDRTLEIAREYNCKIIKIHPNDFTYGYAINLGVVHSTGEIVIILSGHCVPVDNKWLKNLIYPLEREEVIGTYGRQVAWNNTNIFEKIGYSKFFGEKDEYSIGKFSNSNAAVLREALIKYPFDEKAKYAEDALWAKDRLKENYRLFYCSGAKVFHSHNETFMDVKKRTRKEFFEELKMDKSLIPKFKLIHLIYHIIKLPYTVLKIKRVYKKEFLKKIIFDAINWEWGRAFGKYLGYKDFENEK